MKSTSLKKHLLIGALTIGTGAVQPLFANDITQSVRAGVSEKHTPENYFEIGLLKSIGDGPSFKQDGDYSDFGLLINGYYQWNNFFIESYSESGHGAMIGYNLLDTDNWSLDFNATSSLARFNFDNNGRNAGFNGTDPDDDFTVGARLTGFWGDNVMQFSLNQDATGDHDGTTLAATLGRSWQWRNWNFHGLVGAEYATSKLNDYYVGLSDNKALNTPFAPYKADSSLNLSAEAGVTYPLTEDVVVRFTARAAKIDDAITDSPYFNNKSSSALSMRTSISYVF